MVEGLLSVLEEIGTWWVTDEVAGIHSVAAEKARRLVIVASVRRSRSRVARVRRAPMRVDRQADLGADLGTGLEWERRVKVQVAVVL